MRSSTPCGARPGRGGGFTLLEVMVALAILSMALLALLDGVRSGAMAFMRTRDLLTAQTLARRVMTEQLLDEEVPLDDETKTGDFDEPEFEGYSWKVNYKVNDTIENFKQFAPQLNKSLFLVTVKITWVETGAEQAYELRTARLYQTEGEKGL